MRKEDLEQIAKNGRCYANESRDMAKALLAGKIEMSPQEVIDDLRAKGFVACANDVAGIYGLKKTEEIPYMGHYPWMIP